ncbi:hypothetical protein ANCDUO_13909 [Ancylostoma duodenale]|uniref:Uncharacterized protein n=1 Tax=Ancylostoma duodenale TaxID=51022 RepID=A0A0C2CHS9_9BILA|nr:hypothetical protein ANCDUO_13909 [Ancylostoma duodenale]
MLSSKRNRMGHGEDYGNTVENAIEGNLIAWLKKADFNAFPVTTKGTVISYPTYNGNADLLPYSNLVRATNTEIGCVLERCPATSTVSTKLITLYCVLNGK